MAMTVLAIANISKSEDWSSAKDIRDMHHLTTRDCITYINKHFGENISSGSYDDIRRKDLVWPLIRGLVVPSKEVADENDGTRGYAINSAYIPILRKFGEDEWEQFVQEFMRDKPTLDETLKNTRNIPKMPVILPDGGELKFGSTQHNRLQKAIIETFLGIWGQGARVLW